MRWKDFFYYSESDKRGILLLLILLLVCFLLRLFWSKTGSPPEVIKESDSLKTAFEDFQKTLIEDEKAERIRAYQERRNAFYEKYRRNDYSYNDRKHKESLRTVPSGVTFHKQEKLTLGQTISLNTSDTTEWKKIPGIGSGYAKRIVKYRDMLGGFATVDQLKEVYGISDELFNQIKPFVQADTRIQKIEVNLLEFSQLTSHPYLNYKQAKAIVDLRQRKGKIKSVKTLQMLDEFLETDIQRLSPYLSFE